MKYTYSVICFLICFSLCHSQRLKTPSLSPFSEISQEVGLAKLSVEYSRPSAKGRVIFGKLVPYNTLWRTGANASTKISFNETATIGGRSIEAGTYALYTIPRKDRWTIIIHSNTTLRSIAGNAYKPADDIFRFDVTPQKISEYIESFTILFASLKTNSVDLQIAWENTLISIPITFDVDAKIEGQMMSFLKNPQRIPHRTYFEAAQYYSNNGKSLEEALSFINRALEKSPNNFRYGLLRSKILEKNGNRKAALLSIKEAHQWAKNAKNANYIEQTSLFWESLEAKK